MKGWKGREGGSHVNTVFVYEIPKKKKQLSKTF